MTSLHTLSKSWHGASWLYEQLAFAYAGDAIVLLEDAVLAAHSPLTLGSFLAKCKAQQITVYILKEDCRLRGIDSQYPSLQSIDRQALVRLVVEHDKQVAW